jgi:hypothetical protein
MKNYLRFNKFHFPERKIDVEKKRCIGDEQWHEFPIVDLPGVVNVPHLLGFGHICLLRVEGVRRLQHPLQPLDEPTNQNGVKINSLLQKFFLLLIVLLEDDGDGELEEALSAAEGVAFDAGVLHVHAEQHLGQAHLALL